MNRVSYALDIGSITCAIFIRSKIFQMPGALRREKGLELDMTKRIKQLSRTIQGLPKIGCSRIVGSVVIILEGPY